MFYTRIRFALIFLFLALGIWIHWGDSLSSAWYLYFASLLLLATHFLFGNVWAAFVQLRRGKILEAEALIRRVKHPQWLAKRPRAYYYFTKGMIALQYKELQSSEVDLRKALEGGLRSSNDKALAALNLAHIYFLEKRPEDCRSFLQKAKDLQPNDLMIKTKIEEMEKILATPFN